MKNFFITGTDTNVGKTITAAVLTSVLQGLYWKPIQSGVEDQCSDTLTVQELTNLREAHFHPSQYVLKESLSPDQAAKVENITIKIENCQLPMTEKNMIVEGAGGILVPLNANELMLDLIKQINFPVILVARGSLGTINHTLQSIEILRLHNVRIQGIVFCGELNIQNQLAIEKWGKVKTLFHIPYFSNLSPLILQQWIAAHRNIILEKLYESIIA